MAGEMRIFKGQLKDDGNGRERRACWGRRRKYCATERSRRDNTKNRVEDREIKGGDKGTEERTEKVVD